jgi:hypothetical protein
MEGEAEGKLHFARGRTPRCGDDLPTKQEPF